jgi:hypothetical protein
MVYEAEALTPMGGASKATRAGASGGEANNVIKTGSLNKTYQNVLETKIAATKEHFTHIGNRRIMLRIWDPNGASGKIRFRLLWRVQGATRWIENPEQRSFLVGNFSYIDLGEVRPEIAALGLQRWEGKVISKTEGSVGEEAQIDLMMCFPTEQYLIVQHALEGAVAGSTIYTDTFAQAEGNITGKIAPVGGTYEGAGDADDFRKLLTSEESLHRAVGEDSSINNGRFLFLSGSKCAGVAYSAQCTSTGIIYINPTIMRSGLLLRYINISNWVRVCWSTSAGTILLGQQIFVEKCVAGVVTVLKESPLIEGQSKGGTIEVTITKKGLLRAYSPTGPVELIVKDADLATGGALAEGKLGFYDVMANSSVIERFYKKPEAYEYIEEANPICYAGRRVECRSEGVYRQHLTDDIWARLTPDGFLPYAAPSGLEARPMRGIVLPSTGDFESAPDEGNIKVSHKLFYHPGFHFMSEAQS